MFSYGRPSSGDPAPLTPQTQPPTRRNTQAPVLLTVPRPQRKRPLSMVSERSVSVSYRSVTSNEHVYIFIPALKCLNDFIPSLFHHSGLNEGKHVFGVLI